MPIPKALFQKVLSRYPYRKIGSIILILTAIVNLLDVLTTIIGLQLGLHEANLTSIAIMQYAGVLGLTLEKIGMAVVCVLTASLISHWQKELRPSVGLALWIALGVLFGVFAVPVVNNITLIVNRLLGH